MRTSIVCLLLMTAISVPGPRPVFALHHSITVSLFPPDNSLLAKDSIHIEPEDLDQGAVSFLINRSLAVEDISSNVSIGRWYTQEDFEASLFKEHPDSEDIELLEHAKGIFIDLDDIPSGIEDISLVITYSGVLYDSLEAPPAAYAKGFGETSGLIDERGVFLTNESLWYPFRFGAMFTFDLKVDVPDDWMPVSQGQRTDEYTGWAHDEDRVFTVWIEANPTPELYLVAGKYYRHEAYHEGVWVMTYTYEQSDSLAQVYLDATGRYLAMYERLIGDYPFAKFALVENFWQTGFGMPSFTLLGSKVIRLPFIVRTSYGHEILHNWWGNSVFVDYDAGNWCEGLTTYGADYLYKEQMGETQARDYRHHTLISFDDYVTEGKDFPLSEFRERHDPSSQSVGYGKSLMVYHMLRKSLGDSTFWGALREFYANSRFTVASWSDVEAAFSRASGSDLSWYFDQWVSRPGMPSIGLRHADYSDNEGGYEVTFKLEQESPTFVIDLPVRIETTHGTETRMVRLTGTDSTYALPTTAEPVSIAIDPDYDTFRKLYIEEIPITLGSLFGQDSVVVVIGSQEDDSTRASLKDVARAWDLADRIVDEEDFDETQVSRDYIWLMGRGEVMSRLIARKSDKFEIGAASVRMGASQFAIPGNNLVVALRNPYDETLGMGFVLSGEAATLKSLASRIPHYSAYSYIGFEGSRPVLKGVWEERESPLMVSLKKR